MYPKAALMLALVPDGTQSFGLRVMGVVQETGVLDCEHLLMLGDALDCPSVMRRAYALRCHFVVVEEPIGGFSICPIFTRLVDWPRRLHGKLNSQLAASTVQASVL